MSGRLLWLAAACVVGAAGLSQAPAAAREPGLDAADVVRARQAAYRLSAGAFGAMKPVIDGGGDVKPLAFGAKALANWARIIPSMFPAGTGVEAGAPTKARPEIWSDRAGFEQRAADYAAAADKLAQLAEANDKAGFAAQWTAVRQTCSNCHDRYRG